MEKSKNADARTLNLMCREIRRQMYAFFLHKRRPCHLRSVV